MKYEVCEARTQGEWAVEAINYARDGEIYVTIFSGPLAKERATDYARSQNHDEELNHSAGA